MRLGLVQVLPMDEPLAVALADRAAREAYVGHALDLPGEPDHRVGRWAGWLGQDGREEAALAASGFPVEMARQLAVARRAASVAPAEWRLVLQLDTDPATRFEWGDSGRIYVLAREEDLRARALDRCWLLLQCY